VETATLSKGIVNPQTTPQAMSSMKGKTLEPYFSNKGIRVIGIEQTLLSKMSETVWKVIDAEQSS